MMSSISVCRKFLEIFACSHVNDGFTEENGAQMLGLFMNNLQGSPLLVVKELKDKGNDLFRQNYFDRVAACYDEACKLLGLSIGINGGDDVQLITDIVISLNSNLAACTLKFEEYQAALDLCSMILDTFPKNVKALFRRGVAFIKLKRFSEAELDLNEALVVEPKNKDVLRELAMVKEHLLMKDNGKRALEVAHVLNVDSNRKKQVHVSDSFESFKDFGSENMEMSDDMSNRGVETDMKKEDNKRVNMEVTDVGNCGRDLGTGLKENEHGRSTMSLLDFSKKDGCNSRLRIPRQVYQKLVEGKELNFYHKRSLSTTSIRILNIHGAKKRDTNEEIFKKKKRRRCHKKRKSNKMVDLKEDMTRLDFINVESTPPCASLGAASLCDNLTLSDSQTVQVSSAIATHDSSLPPPPPFDMDTIICPKEKHGSKDQQPPLLSTLPQKCKMFSFSFDKFQCGQSTPLFCRLPLIIVQKTKRKGEESFLRRIIAKGMNLQDAFYLLVLQVDLSLINFYVFVA